MSDSNKSITPEIRHKLFRTIIARNITWSGRLDEDAFLSRIFDLTSMDAIDSDYKNAAEEIFARRVKNFQWPEDWIINDSRFELLNCNDESFLSFLCEIIHPVVRFDLKTTQKLLSLFNDHLEQCGWEIVPADEQQQQRIYTARRINESVNFNSDVKIVTQLSREYLNSKKAAVKQAVDIDPAEAVLLAKELIATTCGAVLKEKQMVTSKNNGLPQVMKKTLAVLLPDQNEKSNAGRYENTRKWVLNDLVNVCQGITELCNLTQAAKDKVDHSQRPSKEDAALVFQIAAAICSFLADSYHKQNSISPAAV